MNRKFIIYTDGASRGNPGHASAGFVIQTSDGVIWTEEGQYLGVATNNIAEYTAVKLALEKLSNDFQKYLPAEVEVRADSQLVIRQMLGEYKIKNPQLKVIYLQIQKLIADIGDIVFTHVPREQNVLADKMANLAIDRHLVRL